MGATSIEWTDRSINPLRARLNGHVGHYCEKTSTGCKNCYSSRLQPRFGMPPFKEQRGSEVEHFFDVSKLKEVLRRRQPTKFFWCDMTDMFGEWVPEGWIAACFATMAATPWHTHQVLTKRAERMRAVVSELYANDGARLIESAEWLAGQISACHLGEDEWVFPLRNVHLGVSCEDQQRADERIPHLLATPAAVRWISAEPLLGPLNVSPYMPAWFCDDCHAFMLGRGDDGCDQDDGEASPCCSKCGSLRVRHVGLDWIVVGGESGSGARACDVEWVWSLVASCQAAGIPVFVKQLGANVRDRNDAGFGGEDGDRWEFGERDPIDVIEHDSDGLRHDAQGDPVRVRLVDRKGGDPAEWPRSLRVRQFPEARR